MWWAVRFCGILENSCPGCCGMSVRGVGGEVENRLRSQYRFLRAVWRSLLPSASPCLWQLCPVSHTAAACQHAGRGQVCTAGMATCSLAPPETGEQDPAGPFCCCQLFATACKRPHLKQALLSWALPSHQRVWANILEQAWLLALGVMPAGNDSTAALHRLLLQHYLIILKVWPAATLALFLVRAGPQIHC